MNSNTPSFKGKVTKNVEKYIKKQTQAEINTLVRDANYKGVTVNIDAIKAIKEKWNSFLNKLKEQMSKAHKDSKLDVYPDVNFWGHYGDTVAYNNPHLSFNGPWEHRTCIAKENVLDLLKKLATPDSDTVLLDSAVHNLKNDASWRTTKLGQFITKYHAKKAEKFAREINSEHPNVVETVTKIIEEANTKRALEKQNKRLAENA